MYKTITAEKDSVIKNSRMLYSGVVRYFQSCQVEDVSSKQADL